MSTTEYLIYLDGNAIYAEAKTLNILRELQ